ncbi:glycosyltransferase [Pedobacter sp. ASV28]|uniref:glycosyltransferase n=1 Tax=Pedobacter sp. ASV28 TaxID=2795123 RepID=UPI0018EDBE07|nr:glycosyltransferase [Pedobacter sp. ASV28]
MEAKKILIVSRTFYPENTPRAFRTTELAKQLSATGHEVTVITPRKGTLHDEFEKQHRISIKDLGTPTWKQIKVSGSGIKRLMLRIQARLFNLLFMYPDIQTMFLVNKALRKEKNTYDLLLSIAAPHPVHWGTAWANKKGNPIAKKWIADCGDPFMGGENDTFKRLFYFKYFEKWFCRKANFITVPIADSITAYYPEFRHKIRVIPQGFRFEDVKIVDQVSKNKVPTFAYAGTLIPKIRDPHEFFEFISHIESDYKFIVYTNNPDHVRKYQEQSNGRIELKPFLPRLALLTELQQMDFVVNFENIGPKQSPSKLIDYAIINKPILSVKTFGFDNRPFLEFLNGNYDGQLHIPDPDQYRIENVCNKFINLI